MKCPACHIDLLMTERQGIEIDYCPQCRGVWLDRGELDKMIERSTANRSTADPSDRHVYEERRGPFEKRWDDDDDERHRYGEQRRKSFLGELFDFG
jgi:Zn-finger nucleic acid-binding protein